MEIKCIEVGLVIVLAFVIIMAGIRGKLTYQLPACKIIVYAGILVLTGVDLVFNNLESKFGIGMAVVVSAIFEIASNCCELLGKKKKRVIITEKKYSVIVEEIEEEQEKTLSEKS